jgi:hypothetical protein
VSAYAGAAAAAGGFDRADAHFTRTVAKLDETGFKQLAEACEQLLAKIDAIEAEAAERAASDPHAEEPLDTGLVIMLFEATRLAAPQRSKRRARRPLTAQEP